MFESFHVSQKLDVRLNEMITKPITHSIFPPSSLSIGLSINFNNPATHGGALRDLSWTRSINQEQP